MHVWGPGFGSPSIDPTCLGVIAYLKECLPRDSWVLVPSSDPSLNPLNELPALRVDDVWVAGFENIIAHLRNVDGTWDLDRHLSPSELADCTAYTSFIQSRGRPLLDLYLYVSSENYTACTRPALAKLVYWPNSWFIPHRLRERARKTSEHLGLSGLDVDTAQEEPSNDSIGTQIPKSLRKPQQTVNALLGHDRKRSKFRLNAVTDDFLAPLEEALGDKQWLITNYPSSVDCLCLGYLDLMRLQPKAPQSWLDDALEDRFMKLGEWAGRRREEIFGVGHLNGSIRSHHSKLIEGGIDIPADVPSKMPQRPGIAHSLNEMLIGITEKIPVLRAYITPTEISDGRRIKSSRNSSRKQATVVRARAQQLWFSQLLATSVTVLTLSVVLAHNGVIQIPLFGSQRSPARRTFGQAGSILGIR